MPAVHSRIAVAAREELHVFSFLPNAAPPYPTVVFVHGTIGSGAGGRRWRLRFGRRLANKGIATVNFDHRGCGYSDGRFEETTVSTRLEDLRAVIASLDFADQDRLSLFGASLGSAVAILYEAARPTVKTAILYTLPCEMAKNYPGWFRNHLGAEGFEKLLAGDRVFVSEEFFRKAFLDDLPKHDILRAAERVEKPLLLIQPTKDEQVSEAISMKAFSRAPCPQNEIAFIDGGHEFDENEAQERKIVETAEKWFLQYL